MAPGWMQLLIVAIIALLLFGGRGRISSIMGDLAKGIKSFRKGLPDEDADKQHALDSEDIVNITHEKEQSETNS